MDESTRRMLSAKQVAEILDISVSYAYKREFDRKNQSSKHKKSFCILESEQTEGFLGKNE